MKFNGKVATEKETLEFCNAVRSAGKGRVIKQLFPSYPSDATACLIAQGLNFNCEVRPYEVDGQETKYQLAKSLGTKDVKSVWVMECPDQKTRDAIAEALNLLTVTPSEPEGECWWESRSDVWLVVLPPAIARVAMLFDEAGEGDAAACRSWVAQYLRKDLQDSIENLYNVKVRRKKKG